MPPPYGGVAIHLRRLVNALLERRIDARAVAMPSSRAARLPAIAALSAKAGRDGIVHDHSGLSAFPSSLGERGLRLASRMAGTRRVVTLHDGTFPARWEELPAGRRHSFVDAMVRAERVIAVSDELATFLAGIGIPSHRVVTIPPLLPIPSRRPRLRSADRAWFDAHGPVWTAVGAVDPLYDFATIAAAFGRFREREPRAGLVLLAGGFARDRAYEAELLAAIRPMGGDARLLMDVRDHQALAMFRASSVVIRGPRTESFGLSRAEAAIEGAPVVGTMTGTTRFVIPYEHGGVDSLVHAVDQAIHRPMADQIAAAQYYGDLARSSLAAIIGVYAALGVVPG